MVVDSYDNEEDCKDDYVETEQQVMNVGGLCIYAASRLPCAAVTVCACNYPPKLQYITVWGVQLLGNHCTLWGNWGTSAAIKRSNIGGLCYLYLCSLEAPLWTIAHYGAIGEHLQHLKKLILVEFLLMQPEAE